MAAAAHKRQLPADVRRLVSPTARAAGVQASGRHAVSMDMALRTKERALEADRDGNLHLNEAGMSRTARAMERHSGRSGGMHAAANRYF
jgi:hypothetical protein